MPEQKHLVDVIIFSAFPAEMNYYKNFFTEQKLININRTDYTLAKCGNCSVMFSHTGLGKVAATVSITQAYQHFEAKIALFTGTSGAFDQTLKRGHCIIGKHCSDADLLGIHEQLEGTGFAEALDGQHFSGQLPETYKANDNLVKAAASASEERLSIGHLATSDSFPSPTDKTAALRALGVSSMDMESSAFYYVSQAAGIPALAIRSISNELDDDGRDEEIDTADISTADQAAKIAVHVIQQTNT